MERGGACGAGSRVSDASCPAVGGANNATTSTSRSLPVTKTRDDIPISTRLDRKRAFPV